METYYRQESPERCVKVMKKSGKMTVALICIVLGVILLVFGNRAGGKKGNTEQTDLPEGAVARSVEEYRADLERRMEDICAQVAGVGSVDVIVTLEGGFQYVYACDVKTTSGGQTTTYVTVGSGDDESLVYLSERAPAIVGIGVVCTGGMDATVKREVTNLLAAAFGVGSNKIYVTGRR